MTDVMIPKVFDAFKSAGADDQTAREAAIALSSHHDDILRLWGRMDLLQWMIGFNLVISMAILWKLFSMN